MNTKTTTSLKLRLRDRYLLHEPAIRGALTGCTFIVALLLISRLLAPPAPTIITGITVEARQPIVVIQTGTPLPPLPTLTPWPTPAPVVVEVPAQPVVVEVPVYIQAPPVAAQEAPGQAEEAAPVLEAAPTPEVLCDARCLNIQDHYVEPPRLQTFAVLPGDDIPPALMREAQDK